MSHAPDAAAVGQVCQFCSANAMHVHQVERDLERGRPNADGGVDRDVIHWRKTVLMCCKHYFRYVNNYQSACEE